MTIHAIAREAAAKSRGIPVGVFDDIADAVAVAVLQEVKKLQCRHGSGHYCPNCDRSFGDIVDALLALPVRLENQEEKELMRVTPTRESSDALTNASITEPRTNEKHAQEEIQK